MLKDRWRLSKVWGRSPGGMSLSWPNLSSPSRSHLMLASAILCVKTLADRISSPSTFGNLSNDTPISMALPILNSTQPWLGLGGTVVRGLGSVVRQAGVPR